MRKRRTQQHLIEDLSYNFVEKQVLLGFCVFRFFARWDYGYDGTITTYKPNGEIENNVIYVQIKARTKLKFSEKEKGFELNIEKRDLELWLNQIFPVLIILYDAEDDKAYFIEMKEYFATNRILLKNIQKYRKVYLPKENVFDESVVKKYRIIKNKIHESIKSI